MEKSRVAALVVWVLMFSAASPAQVKSDTSTKWFQATEQKLMDAIASGEKAPWDEVMDASCVITDEEGRVQNKQEFLADLRPLPPGLKGGIAVRKLTVQDFPTFAVVRYLADEWETVFGQRLTTRYRITNTYVKRGTAYKMVAAHTSVVTSDPPAQPVSSDGWQGLVGQYKLLPDGWTFHVVLRDGKLLGGRDPAKLRPLIPMTSDAFALQGSLGEWLFATDKNGKATHIVDLRKFETLIWTRVED